MTDRFSQENEMSRWKSDPSVIGQKRADDTSPSGEGKGKGGKDEKRKWEGQSVR